MPDLAVHIEEWMQNAKRVANDNFKPVMENGPEVHSDSDSEGDGSDDSKSLGNVLEGRHQMSQEQVHTWNMSHNGGSQLHSETQAGPESAVADNRASELKRPTTRARAGVKGYVCDPLSPFPDPGTAADSYEPAIQPPTIGSGVLASKDIIIIHLLGLAPAECLAAPDNGLRPGAVGVQ
jgi:hypothetical protein